MKSTGTPGSEYFTALARRLVRMWRNKRASAEALFRKLSGNGALAGRQAFYIPVGAVTRLQVGPFESRAAASAACNALKGQACFAVK